MPSTKEYLDYILEQLNTLEKISYKKMMGEYLLYYQGVLFGGIYDDRLLVKKVSTNGLFHMEEATPYPGAKPMYLVSEVDNKEILKEIVLATIDGIKI